MKRPILVEAPVRAVLAPVLGLLVLTPACVLIGYDPLPWNGATPVGDGGLSTTPDVGARVDSGAKDMPILDGSAQDAAGLDAAVPDGGHLSDAGLWDDGGIADGGAQSDAGREDADAGDGPVCEREPNACGGCSELKLTLGGTCGICTEGTLVCDGRDALACDGADMGLNGCGSCAKLEASPGDACGLCAQGTYSCSGGGGLVCENPDEGLNACGGCGTLDGEPGGSCGTCGLGVYTCSGIDGVSCGGGDAEPAGAAGLLIDDFEDGDDLANVAGGLTGAWYVTHDDSSGYINPSSGEEFVPENGGANGTGRSGRIRGWGFSRWGASLALSLNAYGCGLNAQTTVGIQFYAKGQGTINFSVATTQTVPVDEGGTCVGNCFNNFDTPLNLTSSWQEFTIPWTSLSQADWGTIAEFSDRDLKYIEFVVPVDSTFDVYVDELRFY